MTKLEVLGASVAMTLLIASPAAADTARIGNFSVEDQFLGTDSVQFGGASVENEFLFFGDDLNNGFFD
ncbi:MAG: hypothetical protein AVDCRST_MAG22-107 [uncultured Rubrobacteraceae bacterium]|uniref:Uncharacterized protein n=1 Tax=uncultured Rubrobacteraceae bacterium TaxID=349277 RepID=A0A6J4NBL6_9ACTN|nr:MAG: hypothetical protein AVDCRST_MAG22-107 [uncultured Rubrobacteraceae bacterium]